MLQNLSVDAVLSDPMLTAGFALLFLGLVGFVFSTIKFFLQKDNQDFAIPAADAEPATPELPASPVPEAPQADALAQTDAPPAPHENAEKTLVVSPEESELRAGLDLALNSISSLSRKMSETDEKIKALERVMEVKLETHELKELPVNANDFAAKLLKLAEHVIVLEREVIAMRKKRSPASVEVIPPDPAASAQIVPPQSPQSTPAIQQVEKDKRKQTESEQTISREQGAKPPIMPL